MSDRFNLGPWQVSVSRDEVAGHGQVHKLEPRTMRLLAVLAQAAGDVVLADDLLAAVWPGLVVTPSSLYDAIAQLRKVLGPEHIATVARKGYRLATPVTPVAAVPSATPAAEGAPVVATGCRLGPRSVAVLPFGALGLPESLSFLSESLTGALISELSRQPDLTLVARGTMLTFGQRHPPPEQLARDLGVRFVVDGQLAVRGDRLHVSVEVVDAWQGTQTWADALELPVQAWHETATVVIGRLARALRFELNDLASQAAVTAGGVDVDLQARALAAQAWVQLFARAQTPETNQRAQALATQARELAPQLAQAWMCLAYCDWRAGQYRWSDEPQEAQVSRAMAEAERAVELDPRDPDAHYVLSLTCRRLGQRLRSDEALRHCLRLAASYAPAHGLLALACIRRGRVQEARAHCDSAFALSPLEPLRVIWHLVRAEACLATDDPQGALDEAQRGMAVNPSYGQVYIVGTAAAWRLGAVAQAHEWVAVLRQHKAFCSLAAARVSMNHEAAAAAQCAQMFDLLRQAGLPAD